MAAEPKGVAAMVTHRANRSPRGRLAIIGASFAVLLALVGFILFRGPLSSQSASGRTSQGQTNATASGQPTSSTGASTTTASTAPSPASPSSAANASTAEVVKAWASCSSQLTAGSALIDVTNQAAATWATHYEAQILYSAHRISLAKTRSMWASSTADGPRQVKDYGAAGKRYRAARRSCRSLPSTVPSTQASAAKACQAKSSAQAEAIGSGSKVAADWATHLHAMTSTPDHGTRAYLSAWHRIVAAAPAKRAAYDRSLSHYQQMAACAAPKA
jgi:hypothetical protein